MVFQQLGQIFPPKPFARVTISFGEIIKFAPVENPDTFESQRLYLEKIMLPELRLNPNRKEAEVKDEHSVVP